MANLSDNFSFLCQVTIDWSASSGTGAVTNMPIHITHLMEGISHEVLFDRIQNGGGGLRCVAEGETQDTNLLNLDVLTFDTTAQEFDIVVRIPNDINKAGSGSAYTIDIWGNNTSSQPARTEANGGSDGTYDSGTVAYVPGQDTGSPLTDRTANADDFTPVSGTPEFRANTSIGPGFDLEKGDTEFVENTNNLVDLSNEDLTILGFFTPESLSSDNQDLTSSTDGTGTGRTLLGVKGTSNLLVCNIGGVGRESNTALSAGVQSCVGVTYDQTGSLCHLYLNGLSDSADQAATGEAANGNWRFGANKTGGQYADGIFKDVHISNVKRSQEFIEAYNDLIVNAADHISSNVASTYLSEFFTKLVTLKIDWTASTGTGIVKDIPVDLIHQMFGSAKLKLLDNIQDGGGGLRIIKGADTDYTNILNVHIVDFDTTADEFHIVFKAPDDLNQAGAGAPRTFDIWGNSTDSQPPQEQARGGQYDTYDQFMLGYWRLQNLATQDPEDSTRNSLTLTKENSPGSGAGIAGNGGDFTPNNYVKTQRNLDELESATFTIECYGKRSVIGENRYLLSMGQGTINDGLHFGFQDTNKLRFGFWDNDLDDINADVSTDWRHFMGSFDYQPAGTNIRTIYLNGEQRAQDNPGSPLVNTAGVNFHIGCRRPNGPTDYWKGGLDEVVVHTTLRSQEWAEARTDLLQESIIAIDQEIETPTSIPSAEFVTPPNSIDMVFLPDGIASAEAFGIPGIEWPQFIEPTGIASGEAFGDINTSIRFSVNSIPSAEAWGQFINIVLGPAFVSPNSIDSGEDFGAPSFQTGAVSISPISIVTLESWGTPEKLSLELRTQSIETIEAFGEPSIGVGFTNITLESIDSAEAFGQPSFVLNFNIEPLSIGSSEAFGVPLIVPGVIQINPNGIISEEGFGEPGIISSGVSIAPESIDSAEAFGLSTFIPELVSVNPEPIDSSESFGSPSFVPAGVNVSTESIDSAEAFGSISLAPGNVFTRPESILSNEAFGSFEISVGGVDVTPNGIVSTEGFGTPNVVMHLNPESINSGELFGEPSISTGNIFLSPEGIFTGEVWGDPTLRHVLGMSPDSIAGAEAFGNPKIFVRVISEFQSLMEEDIEDGPFTEDEEFNEWATFVYDNGESFQLMVIFDETYQEVDPGSGAVVMSRQPMIQAQSSKFKRRPKNGSQVIIRGVNYDVKEYEPDGTGITEIRLHMEKTI